LTDRPRRRELRALQATVTVLALVPVSAGAAGVVLGPGAFDAAPPWPAGLDSHVRFLSGVFLAVGLGFWSCVPRLAARGPRFRLLAALVVAGGAARALSLGLAGPPPTPHLVGLGLELGVVPLLVAWQARVAGRAGG
jgi:hypothetical protein